MSKGGFFSVGSDTFAKACGLGINPAAAFLVLARGSGGDNITTRWSADAVRRRLGVRWKVAKDSIEQLVKARLLKVEKGGTLPIYKLTAKGDLVWLPNALIDGAADEVAPIIRVRQTQDPMVLRLLVDLYGAQNLREDGGVPRDVVCAVYERERIGQHGPYVVWRFDGNVGLVTWSPVTRPHKRAEGDLTDEELADGKNAAVDFFRRYHHLVSMGLVERVPYLFEGPEGEPIHPLHFSGDLEIEADLYAACSSAAFRCMSEGQQEYARDKGKGFYVPVLSAIEQVQLVSIARLRYRPHTTMTGAWWANYLDRCREFSNLYASISPEIAEESSAA